MSNLEVVYQKFALTDSEKARAEQQAQSDTMVAAAPQELVAQLVLSNLEQYRQDAQNIKFPKLVIANSVERQQLTVDVGAGPVSVYFYQRENLPTGQYPLLYFIHGGGFIGGSYSAVEPILRKICSDYDIVCAQVDYHLSPEVRFPVALQESVAGLRAVLEDQSWSPSIDPQRIFMAGDSAGGNLAAAATLYLKNRERIFPAGQILLYPVTEMSKLDTASYQRPEPEFAAMHKLMLEGRKLYAANEIDYNDIYFSPLLTGPAGDSKPTPALFLLAERDGLLDDGILYAKHLVELGGSARVLVYQNNYHAFINGLGDSPTAEHALAEMVRFILSGIKVI